MRVSVTCHVESGTDTTQVENDASQVEKDTTQDEKDASEGVTNHAEAVTGTTHVDKHITQIEKDTSESVTCHAESGTDTTQDEMDTSDSGTDTMQVEKHTPVEVQTRTAPLDVMRHDEFCSLALQDVNCRRKLRNAVLRSKTDVMLAKHADLHRWDYLSKEVGLCTFTGVDDGTRAVTPGVLWSVDGAEMCVVCIFQVSACIFPHTHTHSLT